MIDLTDLKFHLRLTNNCEDLILLTYLDAANELVFVYLGGDSNVPEAKPIDAAVLLLAADLYLNRERQGRDPFNENPTFQLLLAPYRDLEVQ